MKNLLVIAAFFFAIPARALVLINGNQINPQTAISIATFTQTGATSAAFTGTGGLNVTNSSAKVGIGNSAPATTLDVTGTSQFGTTSKSTFSTTGALTMAPNTTITLSGGSSNVTSALFTGALTGNVTGNVTGNAGTVTTNANLTGDVTSVGNATTAAATQANIKVLSGLTTISNAWTSTSSGTVTAAFKITGQTNFSGIAYSSASIPNTSTTTTSGRQCVSNSTLTWTSNGNRATITLQATGGNTGGGSFIADVLLDGVVVAPQSLGSAIEAVRLVPASTSEIMNVGFQFEILPTAGTRQVCLHFRGGSSGAFIDGTNNIAIFSVREF